MGSQGSVSESPTTTTKKSNKKRKRKNSEPASDLSSSRASGGTTAHIHGQQSQMQIPMQVDVESGSSEEEVELQADADDNGDLGNEGNDDARETADQGVLRGRGTHTNADDERIAFRRQEQIVARNQASSWEEPRRNAIDNVHVVSPQINIVNDKDSMKQIIRLFVKKHLFRKLKFWKKADDGGYSSDPNTPAGLFFKTIQLPTLMSADAKATVWASYVPLIGQLHTDHRNNCIKAMQKQYKGEKKAFVFLCACMHLYSLGY